MVEYQQGAQEPKGGVEKIIRYASSFLTYLGTLILEVDWGQAGAARHIGYFSKVAVASTIKDGNCGS